jgi:hypothetical protein
MQSLRIKMQPQMLRQQQQCLQKERSAAKRKWGMNILQASPIVPATPSSPRPQKYARNQTSIPIETDTPSSTNVVSSSGDLNDVLDELEELFCALDNLEGFGTRPEASWPLAAQHPARPTSTSSAPALSNRERRGKH